MELSMSMRYVRIRARQKAQDGPVLAEHTMSALLLLAGAEAQRVMPSGTDAAKAAIDSEIGDLKDDFDVLFGIGDSLSVMARLDELIAERTLDAGAEREFAALQTAAENWMLEDPERGDVIVPVAMLHAVLGKTEMLLEEAMMTMGGASGASENPGVGTNAAAYDPEATVVDVPAYDPEETIVDVPAYDPGETIIDAAPFTKDGSETEADAKAVREAEAEEARRREAEYEEALRLEVEAVRQREAEAWENQLRDAEIARQLLQQQAAAEKQKKDMSSKANGKAVGSFIVFVIVVIAAWQVYLRSAAFGADPSVWWMKLAFFVVYLIAFIASLRSIAALKSSPGMNAHQTTMMRIRVVGTAGMIYFRTVIISTIFPAALLLILSLAMPALTPFWYHFYSIYVFCWMCGLVNLAFQSNVAALSVGNLSWAQLKRKKGAMMGTMFSGMLTVPAVVLFLHWHFDWFPMKTWVIVVLIIYIVFGLVGAGMIGRSSANELQND